MSPLRLFRKRRFWLGLAGLAVLTGTVLFTPLRRVAVIAYLKLGDWREPAHAPQLVGDEVLLFAADRPADRQALQKTYGALETRFDPGRAALVLTGARQPGEHEVCTRRLPADWSGYQLLRLELAGASGGQSALAPDQPLPLRLSLRLRNRPGWRETAWYLQRSFVEPSQELWEIALAPARSFINPGEVRQLCLSLLADEKNGQPRLALRRMLLSNHWSADRSPALTAEPLQIIALSDGLKLRRFAPLPLAQRLDQKGQVTLFAARNEVIAFQLALRRGEQGPEAASLALSPLQGPGDRALTGQLFEERTLTVRQRSSAMFGPGLTGPGRYPDPLVPAAELPLAAGNTLAWVDLTVPQDAPAGEYRGQLSITLKDTTAASEAGQARTLQLVVHVLPLTLPQAPPLVMIYYLPELLRSYTGLTGEPLAKLERAYHRLVQAHGAYLVIDYSLGKLARYLPMLRGTLYTDGPFQGQGAPFWPVNLPLQSKEALQRGAVEAVQWFAAHAPNSQPFFYLADEPGCKEDYLRIKRLASWIHQAPPPGNRLPVMVTEQVTPQNPDWPSLVGSVDFWVSPDNFPEPAASRRKSTSERFFSYNGYEPLAGSQLLDADGVSLRTWGWIAYLFKMEMWFLWQGLYYQDIYNKRGPQDPYQQPLSFDKREAGRGEAFGNGDGIIVYPPPKSAALAKPNQAAGEQGDPVASFRLKALRRGVQDRRYLQLAERCGEGQAAQRIARQLLPRALGESRGAPTAWPKESAPWDKARRQLQQLLLRCLHR